MAEIPPVNSKARFSFKSACLARHHEHAHKGMRGSSELFRFPIAGLEWTYRIVSKSPYAHTRPLCRLPPTELPTKRRAARCPRHTFSSNHAAHLVSDPLSATRYPPWPRVEGLDRGTTRHLPIARSRVLPLGREAIITIAHQYPLWAQATACMIQSKMLRSISLGSGRAVIPPKEKHRTTSEASY